MKKQLSIIVFTLLFAVCAMAQDFLVADGSSSGTYQQFLKEITTACADSPIHFKEIPSSGAIENLDKLVNNEVSAAFMHSDVIYFRGQAENLDKFRTLLALFNEDVHFLALAQSKRIVGGHLGFGGSPLQLNDISDLKGCKVGAAGGGFITIQVIRLQSQVTYEVVQFGSGKEVMDALNTGTIDCAVFVGAAPLPNIKDLGKDYKLLPIPSLVSDRLKSVYKPTTITYTKMSPNGISTIAAQCLFVSKTYKSQKMVQQLDDFRKLFYSKLDDLKETPGNHKKWGDVEADERGHWPWLTLPGDKAPAQTEK